MVVEGGGRQKGRERQKKRKSQKGDEDVNVYLFKESKLIFHFISKKLCNYQFIYVNRKCILPYFEFFGFIILLNHIKEESRIWNLETSEDLHLIM